MPQQSINALDRRVYSSENDAISKAVVQSTEQNICVTDIISEGPIGGLVNGTASVFLNNDPLDSSTDAVYRNLVTEVTLTNGSTSVPVTLNGNVFTATTNEEVERFLQVFAAYKIKVTASLSPSDMRNGQYYTIVARPSGGADFTTIGAPNNDIGTRFTARIGVTYPAAGQPGSTVYPNSFSGTGTVALFGTKGYSGPTPTSRYTGRQQVGYKRVGSTPALLADWDTATNLPDNFAVTDNQNTVDLDMGDGNIISGGRLQSTVVSTGYTEWVGPAYNMYSSSGLTTGSGVPITEFTKERTLRINTFLKIASIENNVITLASAWTGVTGVYKFGVTAPMAVGGTTNNSVESSSKYFKASCKVNPGTPEQQPLETLEGTGSSSIAMTVTNANLEKFIQANSNYTTITATGIQASQIDEVKIITHYPNGVYLQVDRSGSYYGAGVAYHLEIAVNTGVGTPVFKTIEPPASMTRVTFTKNGEEIPVWTKTGVNKSKFSTEFRINLEGLQPFVGFVIRISRMTKHDPEDYTTTTPFGTGKGGGGIDRNMVTSEGGSSAKNSGGDQKHLTGVYTSTVTQALGIIKEKLNFPYTAYANTQFSSKTFQSSPTRSYECFGLKIKVPSNYITREENDGLNARYTRYSEVLSESVQTTPQLWDGAFRGSINSSGVFEPLRVYTDNPAWVFYDICTNDRYGLGDYLKESDIDKFALYKISKYCDELVTDGKGGLEPRFRANLYLTKATDAYKILKDFATIFRGILYWTNGSFKAVMDSPAEPIYNFTRSNVIDGKFEYQSTGNRTRTNQVVVTWNNPEAEYKLEPIIVEDRENIIKTGVLKTEKSVAFGCTSEGQAIRYGRWKLWTAVNQKELVSFKTGVNAAFLSPGDVVNIQDEAEYRVPFSGRLNSYSASSNTVTIDREVRSYFSSGYEYTIAIVIPTRSIVLNQEVATIVNSSGVPTTYSKGDVITHATIGTTTTELLNDSPDITNRRVLSALDTSNTPVSLQYIEETLIEERVLNSSSGGSSTSEGRDTIAFIGDDFLVAPTSGAIWAIKQKSTNTGQTVAGSFKQFRILDIGESGPTEFDITAVEYYSDKFDAIDSDFLLATPDPLYPREGVTSDVPKPTNIRVLRTPNDELEGEELRVEWDAPKSLTEDGAFLEYEYLSGYEVEHTFNSNSGTTTTEFIDAGNPRSATFVKVPNGPHQVSISTKSKTMRRSPKAMFNLQIDDIFEGTYPRLGGIIKGGYSTKDIEAPTQAGVVSFTGNSYVAAPFTAMQSGKRNTLDDADSYSISCAAIADISWPIDADSYIMMDFSKLNLASPNANCLKVISRRRDSVGYESAVDYWYDATKYVANRDSIWTSVGNVSVTNNTSKIVGSGFLNLKIPEVVTIGPADYATSGTGTRYLNTGRDAVFGVIVSNTGAASVTVRAGGLGYVVNETVTVLDANIGAGGGSSLTFDVATITSGIIGTVDTISAPDTDRTPGTYTLNSNDDWATVGQGVNAKFSVVISNTGAATVTVTDPGDGFLPDDMISIEDSVLGGGGGATLTFDIASIATGGAILTVDTVSAAHASRKAGAYNIGAGFAGKIALIVSDTLMYLDRSWTKATNSSLAMKKQELDIDYQDDFLIAPISYNAASGGSYSLGGTSALSSFLEITEESALRSRSIVVTSNIQILNYSASSSQTTTYSNITLFLSALNYDSPEYNVTGTGFNQLNTSADGANTFTAGSASGQLSKIIQTGSNAVSYNASPIELIVKVREGLDPTNVSKQRVETYVISKIKDGLIGEDGKTVFLTADDYSIIYDEEGVNPTYTSSGSSDIVFTADANNFTDPLYRFTFAGTATGWVDTTNATNATYTYSSSVIPATYNKANWPKVIKVEVGEKPSGWTSGGAPNSITATDSVSLLGVKTGSGGIAVSNSNAAHTYTTDKDGLIGGVSSAIIPNSSTTLEVIVGGIVYNYAGGSGAHNYNAISDASLNNKEWYVFSGVCTSGGSNISVGNPTGETNDVLTIGNHQTTANTNADEIITWTINYKQAGVVKSIKTTQTLSKSITGATGLNNATAEIYKLSASSGGATTKPLGDTIYTFAATGAKLTFSSTGSNPSQGWTEEAPTPTTLTPYLYKRTGNASSNVATATIASSDWSPAILVVQPGADGVAGKSVRITANQYYVKYRASNSLITEGSGSIAFTANPSGFTGTPTYQWQLNGVNTVTTSTYAYPKPGLYGTGTADVISCTVSAASGDSGTATDKQAVARLKEGVLSAYLTNSSHSVPANSNGIVTAAALAAASGEIKVFDGITELTSGVTYSNPVQAGGPAGGGYADNLGLTLGSTTGVYSLYQVNAGWIAGNDWSTFTIRATITSTGTTIDLIFSVAKIREGADAAMKITSYVYWQGAVAEQSLSTLDGKLAAAKAELTSSGMYSIGTQNNNASFNPDIGAGTAGTTYTGTGSEIKNWSTTPPVVDGTRGTLFYAPYTVTEAIVNGVGTSLGAVEFGSVALGTSFSGLVTFQALAADLNAGGTANITQIDGGKINTKSISAEKLVIGETGRTSVSRVLLLEDSVKVFEGQTLRVHLGNLSNNAT